MNSTRALSSLALKSRFFRQVMVLMSWTIVAQIISTGSMLVLPRLFDQTQFGLFAVFSAFTVLAGIVAAGRYEFAIGLPRKTADSAALFTLCMLLATFVPTLVIVIVKLVVLRFVPPHGEILNICWSCVAVGATCIAWYNAAGYMALREGGFNAVGKSKAIVAAITAAAQVCGGLWISQQAGTLIISYVCGQAVGVAFLIWIMNGTHVWTSNADQLRQVAKRFVAFPKFIALGSLFDGIAALLPVTGVATLFSPADAGVFALADRMLRAPVTLIGSSVLQVFYQHVAKIQNDASACRKLLVRTWLQMAAIGIIPCMGLAIFGESLFSMLFGVAWQEAGRVAEIMSVSTFFFFVSYPTSNILVIRERPKSYLIWQAAQLFSMIVAFAISLTSAVGNLNYAVICIVSAQVVVYLLSLVLQYSAVSTSLPVAMNPKSGAEQ